MSNILGEGKYLILDVEQEEYIRYLPQAWHGIIFEKLGDHHVLVVDVIRNPKNMDTISDEINEMYDVAANEKLYLVCAAVIVTLTFIEQIIFGLNIHVILATTLSICLLAGLHIKDSYLVLERYRVAMARLKQLRDKVRMHDDEILINRLNDVVSKSSKINDRYLDLITLTKESDATALFQHVLNIKEGNVP